MEDHSCLHTDMEVFLIDCNYTYDHKLFEFSYFCSLRFTLRSIDVSISNGLSINVYQNRKYRLLIKIGRYDTKSKLKDITKNFATYLSDICSNKIASKDVLIHLKEQTFN